MDGNCNGGFRFEQRVGDFVASPPIMSYAAESLLRLQDIHSIPCSSANGLNSFLSSAWNPLVAMPHHHPVDSPTMVSSLDVLKCNQVVTGNVSHCNYPEEIDMRGAKMAAHLTDDGGEHETSSEEKIPIVAVERKRKRIPDTGDAKDYSSEKLNIVSHTTGECSHEKHEKTQASPLRKSSGKQLKEHSRGVDAPKEDYIHHVRAKRGQATNSHSLAERERREKISERMKFLQDLVPGCNKVIGKAVMLDEIINYVQSLQRQVEILNERGTAILGSGGDSRLVASNSHLFVSTRASVGICADPLQVTNAQILAMPQMVVYMDCVCRHRVCGMKRYMALCNRWSLQQIACRDNLKIIRLEANIRLHL